MRPSTPRLRINSEDLVDSWQQAAVAVAAAPPTLPLVHVVHLSEEDEYGRRRPVDGAGGCSFGVGSGSHSVLPCIIDDEMGEAIVACTSDVSVL